MKRLILATAFVLATGAAYAADVLQEAPVAASFDWTGAYIGVNAGGGWGTFKHTTNTSPIEIDVSASGFLGGIQAGYNWQSGQVVYGVETDFQAADIKGDLSFPITILQTKVDRFGTLRGRIGFTPADRFMVYGTGGLAYGHFKTEINNGAINGSKTKAGWTVGAGAEYAINANWTIKSEYLYTDLGKSDVITFGPNTLTDKIAFHTVRVGLNYKF
ncbi:31 kDa outer-membrane immunogenic protein [Mesorhizobium sp. ORS 3324]|nr:31 kDa outer-membrane immunogenic protein [Mesorhizobium sp. ORS 3324]